MVFDKNWEDFIYSKEKQVNHFPHDWVVATVNRIFAEKPDRSDLRVLELGCGSGANLRFLAEFGFSKVDGIDGAQSALRLAEKNIPPNDKAISLFNADFTSIPAKDKYYSLVLDRGSITHNDFESCKKVMAESYRVLKPGGIMLTSLFSNSHSAIYNAEPISRLFYRAFKDETLTEQGLNTCFFGIKEVLEVFEPFEIISCIHDVRTEMFAKPATVAMWYLIGCKQK